jgi:environmental stress-induced protein Ves
MSVEFSMTTLDAVLDDVRSERLSQKYKWGNDAHMHANDWHAAIEDYNGMARRKLLQQMPADARERFIQIAALAVAAVEQIDNGYFSS